MKGDFHVRFCGKVGVKFPLSTRHQNATQQAAIAAGAEMLLGVQSHLSAFQAVKFSSLKTRLA